MKIAVETAVRKVEYLDVKSMLTRLVKPGNLALPLLGRIGRVAAENFRTEFGRSPYVQMTEVYAKSFWACSYNLWDPIQTRIVLEAARYCIATSNRVTDRRRYELIGKIDAALEKLE